MLCCPAEVLRQLCSVQGLFAQGRPGGFYLHLAGSPGAPGARQVRRSSSVRWSTSGPGILCILPGTLLITTVISEGIPVDILQKIC